MSRFNALLLLCFASMVSPAFSADTAPGTTLPDDIDPATGLARTTVVKPLSDAPPVPDPRATRPPTGRPHIALILPTGSETLGRLAETLRQGFMAAAEAGGKDAPPVTFTAIDNEGEPLLAACREAQARGALLAVAAITRDGATALSKGDCRRLPVLALNEPQGGGEPAANFFHVSLSLEHEARQAALLAVAEGWHSAIVITSVSPLARRVQEAFEREWVRAAGELRARITFRGGADEAMFVRERIASVQGADMVFLALDQPEARAVRPYVSGMLPLYATSMSVNPRAEAIVNVDLQGVRYVEMPWFVQPDHPAVMIYPAPRSPMGVEQERLYAFGIDGFRLAMLLLRGDRRAPLDGVTARITLEGAGAFARHMTPAEVDGGRVIPLRSP